MVLNTSPRHTRHGFISRICSRDLAISVCKNEQNRSKLLAGIIDFSPENKEEANFFAELADELVDESELIDFSPEGQVETSTEQNAEHGALRVSSEQDFECFANIFDREKIGKLDFELPMRSAKIVQVATLDDGGRQETFDNGSLIKKDALGRPTAVYAQSGECLLLHYDKNNELCEYLRVNPKGELHSIASKTANSVTVRDSQGRVRAVGDSMSVDPWGRFYLYTRDNQFFCIDLVERIHLERRRLSDSEGAKYITAAFTHDGFRMATTYTSDTSTKGDWRNITYRFYGRDGSLLQFNSEQELRDLQPSQAKAPGSMPVHQSWNIERQAETAWNSLRNLCGSNTNRHMQQIRVGAPEAACLVPEMIFNKTQICKV